MKKNLLFGFLAASALLGAAPLANAGVVLEEDFNQFTDGTTSKPGNVDIAASGKLGDMLLGWTGDAIYEAGGSLFVGTTDVLDFDPHSISTPDLDLDAKDGNIRITLRVKSWTEYGNMINIKAGDTKLSSPYFEDGEWHDFVIVTDKGLPGALSISSASLYSTPFFIDYLKIEQGDEVVPSPTSLRPTDYDGTTFSARWLSVPNATGYTVSVYNKDAKGNRINVKTYDAEPLPEGDTSGNRVIVTVDDNTLKYYFVVVAKRGTNISTESNESEVIKHVESLAAPTALAATDVTTNSFTANWTAVPDADTYTATLYKTITLTEDSDTEILNEDFAGITKGSFDLIDLPSKDPDNLDAYTHTPGWYASTYAFGGGSLVLWPMFGSAFFVTPSLDLSGNGGVVFVDFTAAAGDSGKYKTGEKVTVDLLTQANNETTVLESAEIELDEGAFKNYGTMFTKGAKGTFIRFSYGGTSEVHFDDVVITQKTKAGDKVRTVAQQVETTGLSAKFTYEPAANTEYSYKVFASVNTITAVGMDDVVYSGASNEIVVGGADGVADVAAAGFKVFARNGRLVVDAAEAAPVTVVDAYGRVIAAFEAHLGENAVDCQGFVIVRVGDKVVKTIVR